LGAFDFTALPRAQLAMAEQVYSATADLLLASDRHPAAIAPLEEGLTEPVSCSAGALEWPPEVLAADELAHLGFYVGSDLHKHAMRIAEEFSTIDIAQLGAHPHNAPVSIAGLVTSLRVRQTKKGEEILAVNQRRFRQRVLRDFPIRLPAPGAACGVARGRFPGRSGTARPRGSHRHECVGRQHRRPVRSRRPPACARHRRRPPGGSGAELIGVPGPEDLTTLVHELVQQQAAFGQQQAALLQLQAETVRLKRLLIERALGASGSDTAVAPLAGSSIRVVLAPQVTASEVVRPDVHAAELIAMRDPSTALVETEPLAGALAQAETHHPPPGTMRTRRWATRLGCIW
jgi:hypothetical protein